MNQMALTCDGKLCTLTHTGQNLTSDHHCSELCEPKTMYLFWGRSFVVLRDSYKFWLLTKLYMMIPEIIS